MLVERRKCDITWVRNNNESGRGSRRTFGSERDAGLSPCRCLSTQEVPFGGFFILCSLGARLSHYLDWLKTNFLGEELSKLTENS